MPIESYTRLLEASGYLDKAVGLIREAGLNHNLSRAVRKMLKASTLVGCETSLRAMTVSRDIRNIRERNRAK